MAMYNPPHPGEFITATYMEPSTRLVGCYAPTN